MPDNLPIEPQLIIFIVVALIGFARTLLSKKKGEPQWEEQWDNDQPGRGEATDPMAEFERMIQEAKRKAEEQEEPAPPSQESSTPPPPPPPPRVVTTSAPDHGQPPPITPSPPADNGDITPSAHPELSLPTFVHESSVATPAPPLVRKKRAQRTSVRTLLSSPSAARQAVILKEVLGKPKGYQ